MKCCVQRVLNCSVEIDGKQYSKINKGLLVFLGIDKGDELKSADWLVNKLCGLRIFYDETGKMTLDVNDVEGEICIVSQFTLSGKVKKGRRPDFTSAMRPEAAEKIYEYFIEKTKEILGENRVKTGVFGADMKISLINDGPVTIIMEKKEGE